MSDIKLNEMVDAFSSLPHKAVGPNMMDGSTYPYSIKEVNRMIDRIASSQERSRDIDVSLLNLYRSFLTSGFMDTYLLLYFNPCEGMSFHRPVSSFIELLSVGLNTINGTSGKLLFLDNLLARVKRVEFLRAVHSIHGEGGIIEERYGDDFSSVIGGIYVGIDLMMKRLQDTTPPVPDPVFRYISMEELAQIGQGRYTESSHET